MTICKVHTTIDRINAILIEAEGWCDELYWCSVGLPLKQAAIRQRNRIRHLLDGMQMLHESMDPRTLDQLSPKETGVILEEAVTQLKESLPRTARELESRSDAFMTSIRESLEILANSLESSGRASVSKHVAAIWAGTRRTRLLQTHDLPE